MSDQRSQGGKKEGTNNPQGNTDKHQTVQQGEAQQEGQEGVAQRPPKGQPGGPKHRAKSGRSGG